MFAVLKTGGKQYKVSKNDVIIVEKLSTEAGDVVQFDQVLMTSDGKFQVGTPSISGAAVHAEVIEQTKNKKVISFVKRRRKHSSQRTRGHRQNVTVLRITDILTTAANTGGTQIEVGVTIIGSNPKAAIKPLTKTDVVKKPASKSEMAKKPTSKTEVAKKPAAKTEVAKKPAAKTEVANAELTTKSEAEKKPAANKPVAKAEVTKKPMAKKPVSKS